MPAIMTLSRDQKPVVPRQDQRTGQLAHRLTVCVVKKMVRNRHPLVAILSLSSKWKLGVTSRTSWQALRSSYRNISEECDVFGRDHK